MSGSLDKKVIAVIFAFAIAPAGMFALESRVFPAEECLVRVYHTNFRFPPEGGEIIKVGNELFFAKTYLPECSNLAPSATVSAVPRQMHAQPHTTTAPPPDRSFGQGVVDFLVGDSCLIPVYHADFVFPPEGGKVVRLDDQLYFVPDYLPGCRDAGRGGVVVRSADQRRVAVPPPETFGGSVLDFLVGDPCLVPIYHTNFRFPPEGGEIIKVGNELFFAKTYLPGCERFAFTT